MLISAIIIFFGNFEREQTDSKPAIENWKSKKCAAAADADGVHTTLSSVLGISEQPCKLEIRTYLV